MLAILHALQIHALGHRFLQRGGIRLLGENEIHHLLADFFTFRHRGQTLLGFLAVVLQFQHVAVGGKAALGARDSELLGKADPVLPACQRTAQPTQIFFYDRPDHVMLVERAVVLAQKCVEARKRVAKRIEIAPGGGDVIVHLERREAGLCADVVGLVVLLQDFLEAPRKGFVGKFLAALDVLGGKHVLFMHLQQVTNMAL